MKLFLFKGGNLQLQLALNSLFAKKCHIDLDSHNNITYIRFSQKCISYAVCSKFIQRTIKNKKLSSSLPLF